MANWRETLANTFEGWFAESRTIHGIPVVVLNTREDIETERVFERLEGALGVIDRHQPHRLRRLRTDIDRILVKRFPCRAAYFPDTRTCLIELTFSGGGKFSDAQVAASIVHEGVHARLYNMGLAGHPGCEAREERLCREAELELGLAVPDGGPVVERALASLALGDAEVAPAVDWSVAAQRVADADAAARRSRGE